MTDFEQQLIDVLTIIKDDLHSLVAEVVPMISETSATRLTAEYRQLQEKLDKKQLLETAKEFGISTDDIKEKL